MAKGQKHQTGSGPLFIIGGHEDREGEKKILRAVAERVGSGKLVVATVASEEPEDLWQEYRKAFRGLGVKKIEHLNVNNREEALDEKQVKIVEGASAVFFTGGDQLRITSQLGDSLVYRTINRIYEEGGTIAGTSAGASVMSGTMLIDGEAEQSHRLAGMLRMAPGLGLIQDVVIDQHFAERGRLGRLLGAVTQNPAVLGIGIDENTAICVENDRFLVLGEGAVYVVDGELASYSNIGEADKDRVLSVYDVKLHVMSEGHGYDLRERRPLPPPAPPTAAEADRQKQEEEERKKRAEKAVKAKPKK